MRIASLLLMMVLSILTSEVCQGGEPPVGGKPISSNLFGLFFEDINYAADGGLYAELVQNRSFEYAPAMQKGWHPFTCWDFLRAGYSIGYLNVGTSEPIHPNNPTYAVLDIELVGAYPEIRGLSGVGIINSGFDGMPVNQGDQYFFSFFARLLSEEPVDFLIQLQDTKGKALTGGTLKVASGEWQKYELTLTPEVSCDSAALLVLAQSKGKVALDMVSLFPEKTFMGRRNGMRADLAQVLAELQPRFMRFPGGCLVHGDGISNIYDWKNTVGPVEHRKAQRNIWNYQQGYGLGYFEFFQFCEDIGAAAVPVLPAGVSCQNSGGTHVIGGAGQQAICMEDMDAYIQDVLDLIEWAKGPADSKWGSVRAAAGRVQPFNLEYIGIGNEEKITPEFEVRFKMIQNAIREKYPEVKLIGTSGPFSDGDDFERGWEISRKLGIDIVDEHYYKGPDWMLANLHRYDSYDREGPKVYLGEYASWGNKILNAVAEAAYMIGLERNGDVVSMASYAPLLARKGNTQWTTDLIFFDNRSIVLTPNYYVQKMFMNNQGDYYYDGLVTFTTEDPLLSASTVYDSTTGDVIIKIANPGMNPSKARADLSGFKGLGSDAQCFILRGAPDAENTFDAPTNVHTVTVPVRLNNATVLEYEVPAMSVTTIRIKKE